MTQKVQDIIINQTRFEVSSKQIILMLRLDIDEKNLIIKLSNVYNVKSKIRSEALEFMISI